MAKDIITMEIARSKGKTIFKFKVPQRISDFYKSVATEIVDSSSWRGLKFYYLPQITDSKTYKQKLESNMLFDDYGCGLYRNGFLNIAWLRTVGAEGQITVNDTLSFAEMSVLTQNATRFIKGFFEEHLADFKIGGSVTLEV